MPVLSSHFWVVIAMLFAGAMLVFLIDCTFGKRQEIKEDEEFSYDDNLPPAA